MDVLIDSNTKIRAMKDENREEITVSPVNRVLTGDFIDVHTELYDVTSDPAETRDIVDERPDIAQELEEMLALWTQSLLGQVKETTGSVDLDAELSWNYELGVRANPGGAFSYEATLFRMDFENQIVPARGEDVSERGATRMDDKTSDASMEKRKKDGYF